MLKTVKMIVMLKKIDNMLKSASSDIDKASSQSELDGIKLKYLGRDGEIQDIMVSLRHVKRKDRSQVGIRVNESKREIVGMIEKCIISMEETSKEE